MLFSREKSFWQKILFDTRSFMFKATSWNGITLLLFQATTKNYLLIQMQYITWCNFLKIRCRRPQFNDYMSLFKWKNALLKLSRFFFCTIRVLDQPKLSLWSSLHWINLSMALQHGTSLLIFLFDFWWNSHGFS